jgi:hypothetical protein
MPIRDVGSKVVRLVVAATVLALGGAEVFSQTAPTVTVSFVAKNPQSTLHEPVLVLLTIQNGSGQAIEIDLGLNRKANLEFTVTEPDGSVIRVPRLSSEGFGRIGRVKVEPGKSYEQELLLNEWYQFSRPGNYKVKGALVSPVKIAGAIATVPEAKAVELTVRPGNPEVLSQTCQRLLGTALSEASLQVALEAAGSLSYVVDPICVSHLRQLLEKGNPQVRQYGAHGLGRIANREAIDILASNLDTPDADLSAVVRGILSRLRNTVTDPALKQVIERALSRV